MHTTVRSSTPSSARTACAFAGCWWTEVTEVHRKPERPGRDDDAVSTALGQFVEAIRRHEVGVSSRSPLERPERRQRGGVASGGEVPTMRLVHDARAGHRTTRHPAQLASEERVQVNKVSAGLLAGPAQHVPGGQPG